MFSSLLSHKECCKFENGEYIKSGLAELELWCTEATEEVYYIWSLITSLTYIYVINDFIDLANNYFCCSALAHLWMSLNIQSKQLDSWYAYYFCCKNFCFINRFQVASMILSSEFLFWSRGCYYHILSFSFGFSHWIKLTQIILILL